MSASHAQPSLWQVVQALEPMHTEYAAQSVALVHDGEHAHVEPSGRHTFVMPPGHPFEALPPHAAAARATSAARLAASARARVSLGREVTAHQVARSGLRVKRLPRYPGATVSAPSSLRRAAASFALATVAVWGSRAHAECSTAADCTGGKVCQEGRCVVTPGAAESQDVHRLDTSRDAARFLTIGGIAALGTGYLAAAVGGGVGLAIKGSEESKYGGSCGGASGLSFIPLVGPLLTATQYPNHQIAAYGQGTPFVFDCHGARTAVYALAITDEVFQIGGLGMLIAGLAVHATIIAQTDSGRLELIPGNAGSPLGLTMQFVQF